MKILQVCPNVGLHDHYMERAVGFLPDRCVYCNQTVPVRRSPEKAAFVVHFHTIERTLPDDPRGVGEQPCPVTGRLS